MKWPESSLYQLVPVKVTFLEMHQTPATTLTQKESVFHLLPKPISLHDYRKFYSEVGQRYYWLDRIFMSDVELNQKINSDKVDVFLMHVDNEAAGFVEFVKDINFVEILYFGLAPSFVGKGWGHHFLHWAIKQAWSYGPKWIQLNTCDLDHPNALAVYKKAGFQIVRTEMQQRKVLTNHQSGNFSIT